MAIRKLNPKDFYVGMMVPLRYEGNKARGGRGDEYRMAEVTKIGRKYIHCGTIAFELETGYEKSDYAASYKLYESEKALFDDIEAERITSKLSRLFDYSSQAELSLEQLRAIADIIGFKVEVPKKQV